MRRKLILGMRIMKITLTCRFVNCQNGIQHDKSRCTATTILYVGVRTYFFRFLWQILCTNINYNYTLKRNFFLLNILKFLKILSRKALVNGFFARGCANEGHKHVFLKHFVA